MQVEHQMRSALSLDPTYYPAHYILAVALKNLSDYPEAAKHYSHFLAVAPVDARKRPNALYAQALCEAMSKANKGGGGRRTSRSAALSSKTLAQRLDQARVCEAELEVYWGKYDIPDKELLETLVMAGH